MVATLKIKQGLDIPLAGRPGPKVEALQHGGDLRLFPGDLAGCKLKLLVQEGATVQAGDALVQDKAHPGIQLLAPVSGTIKQIVRGERRKLQEIVLVPSGDGAAAVVCTARSADQLLHAPSSEILDAVCKSGLISLIQRRPFSRMADPTVRPKSIFINAMATAPFRADPAVAIRGREADFQAGINALGRLTDGAVFLCVSPGAAEFHGFRHVAIHAFDGPHPSGNTSTHIHHLDPIHPGDTVWAVSAADLVLIGSLLRTGHLPTSRLVALGGPAVLEPARHHYLVPIGAPVSLLTGGRLVDAEVRLIKGDVLQGDVVPESDAIHLSGSSFTALEEDRSREFMGWLLPGHDKFSASNLFVSRLMPGAGRTWSLGTSRRGSLRSMVLTGIYDRYVPLNIMVDYLVRACLARDTDEAIKLGILETDPEDFALCTVICPSKTDFGEAIRKTLHQIELEGF